MAGIYYEEPDEEQRAALQHAMASWHRDLLEHGLAVTLLVAHGPTDDDGEVVAPAIMHNGYRALAVVKIVQQVYRAAGIGDVLVIIDGDRWEELDDETRLAVLDHELTHVELQFMSARPKKAKKTKPGEEPEPIRVEPPKLVVDGQGRPRITMRKHDKQYGWFDEVAKRHGAASIEVQQATEIFSLQADIYIVPSRRRRVS